MLRVYDDNKYPNVGPKYFRNPTAAIKENKEYYKKLSSKKFYTIKINLPNKKGNLFFNALSSRQAAPSV